MTDIGLQRTPRRPRLVHTRTALSMLELIYHSTVREIRKTHRNALMGLLLNILQTIIFIVAFYYMFNLIGVRGSGIYQADFLIYIMSGIFLFLTHSKAMGAVIKSDGPTSAMMQHAPLNTVITICSSALAALYTQLLALFVVLFLYHALITPVVIDHPIGAFGMLLLAWFSGVAIGVIFLALRPWYPEFVTIASSIYSRANMIASGKMFVANALPGSILVLFDWNPLFHAIDQARGFAFIHYTPHNSNIAYPIILSLVLIVIGLMGEHYTRRHASVSWGASR